MPSIGSDACIKKIIERGANITLKDDTGRTALDYAQSGLKYAKDEIKSQNYANTIALLTNSRAVGN